MTDDRYVDDDGHFWPITGCICVACGLPLIPVDNQSDHPTCQEQAS